jgi:translation initiation factor 3 subunit L
MYVLLAICLVLHPQRIDESLHSMLKEKNYADRMNKMQQGDLGEFESCFSYACPKFLSPVAPTFENSMNDISHKEPLRLQLKVFMEEVKQQMLLPTVRSYLKLYTSMPMEKLATYMNISVDELENHLLCFKHKMMNVVWTKGTSGLDGDFQSESEVRPALILVLFSPPCKVLLFAGRFLHRQEHDSHCRHESGSPIRRLLHPSDSQI